MTSIFYIIIIVPVIDQNPKIQYKYVLLKIGRYFLVDFFWNLLFKSLCSYETEVNPCKDIKSFNMFFFEEYWFSFKF